MKALTLPQLTPEAIKNLDRLYHTARDPRLHVRAHIVLLAAEKSLPADEIAEIVRTDAQTVRRWLKRYSERGLSGLYDAPRPGGPRKVTDAYLEQLTQTARRPPSDAGLPHDHWTAKSLAEHMAACTGIAVNPETVRLHLKAAGINLEEPQGDSSAPPHKTVRVAAKRQTP